MHKATQPEIIMVPQGMAPEHLRMVRDGVERAGFAFSVEPKAGLVPIYPDRRIMPRECQRTGMFRRNCCCAPCRALRRRKHRAACRCWLCYSDRQGAFIDSLGGRTAAGRWLWFLTLSFRTRPFVKRLNAAVEQPEPNPDFAHRFFRQMIRWIEGQMHGRVEYFMADQFGESGGRLHLHCGLSWPGLFEYRWKDLQAMLWQQAGFNRILPWEKDAGYYIGRYIGRDASRCDWDFRVDPEPVRRITSVGRQVVAVSPAPDNSSDSYRQALSRWHR